MTLPHKFAASRCADAVVRNVWILDQPIMVQISTQVTPVVPSPPPSQSLPSPLARVLPFLDLSRIFLRCCTRQGVCTSEMIEKKAASQGQIVLEPLWSDVTGGLYPPWSLGRRLSEFFTMVSLGRQGRSCSLRFLFSTPHRSGESGRVSWLVCPLVGHENEPGFAK